MVFPLVVFSWLLPRTMDVDAQANCYIQPPPPPKKQHCMGEGLMELLFFIEKMGRCPKILSKIVGPQGKRNVNPPGRGPKKNTFFPLTGGDNEHYLPDTSLF